MNATLRIVCNFPLSVNPETFMQEDGVIPAITDVAAYVAAKLVNDNPRMQLIVADAMKNKTFNFSVVPE
jgi:hypothetical protein